MNRHRPRTCALLAALTTVVLAACGPATVAGTGTGTGSTSRTSTAPAPATSTGPAPRSAAPQRPRVTGRVHVGLFEADGQTYGVGMPIIVRFRGPVTYRAAFAKDVTVDVNGRPADGAWAWEPSSAPGWDVEAHYREEGFWPAHSTITVDLPLRGRLAGPHTEFGDDLTLSMGVGAAHISTVYASDTSPRMVVTSDGHVVRTLPVSLGDAQNETYRGTKIVEEFDRVEDMGGADVPWSVRLTNTGEFVHAAPWNHEIGQANLSHGCTNLTTADARWFYGFSRLGDVVQYPDAPGRLMSPTDGFGDWNVPWAQWRAGGEL